MIHRQGLIDEEKHCSKTTDERTITQNKGNPSLNQNEVKNFFTIHKPRKELKSTKRQRQRQQYSKINGFYLR